MTAHAFKGSLEEENKFLREQLVQLQHERDVERCQRIKLENILQEVLTGHRAEQHRLELLLEQVTQTPGSDTKPLSKVASMETRKMSPSVKIERFSPLQNSSHHSTVLGGSTIANKKLGPPRKPKFEVKVEIPVRSSSWRRRILSAPALLAPKEEFKDAKIKIEKNDEDPAPPLPFATCDQLKASLSSLEISPPPLSLSIARATIGKAYSMSSMSVSTFDKGRDSDCHFLFPERDWNPDLPNAPGDPGFFLGIRPEFKNRIWSLMIKISHSPARWTFYGLYTIVGYELPAEEFARLGSKTKEIWGECLSTNINHGPYRKLRARLTLRQRANGIPPTDAQVVAEVKKIKKQKSSYSGVTSNYAIAALERGDEHINIYKLECVSYSHELAREYQKASDMLVIPGNSDLESDDDQEDDSSTDDFPTLSKSSKRKRNLSPSPPPRKQKKRKTPTVVPDSDFQSTLTLKAKGKGKKRELPVKIEDESESELNSDSDFRASSNGSLRSTAESSTRRSQRQRKESQKLRMQQ